MRSRVAVAAAILALSACARETPITAAQLPSIRAGQWSFEGSAGGGVAHGAVCLKTFADTLGRSHPGCAGFAYSREAGGAVVVRDRCVNPNGAVVQTRIRLAGDYASRMSFEDDIHIAQPTGPPLHTLVRISYRYAGCPCPPPA